MLSALGLGLGWFFERRKRRAEARKVEADASHREAETRNLDVEQEIKRDDATVSHVDKLLDKAERVSERLLAVHAELMGCRVEVTKRDLRIMELEADANHMKVAMQLVRDENTAQEEMIAQYREKYGSL